MDQMLRPGIINVTLTLSLVASVNGTASATTYCVTCDGPNAEYACSVDAPDHSSVQIYCISELAKAGNHASCAVNRDHQQNCQGAPRTLALPDGLSGGGATPAVAPPKEKTAPPDNAAADAAAQDKSATDSPAKPEGNAVTNAAKGLAKETAKALEKTGDAITGAAKKSWSCVTSLFSDC